MLASDCCRNLARAVCEPPSSEALRNRASSDHLPGPLISRKATTSACAYSDRTSCKTAQNPIRGGAGGRGKGEVPRYSEILVESIATIISTMKGTEIHRVREPDSKSSPPPISSSATKSAVK